MFKPLTIPFLWPAILAFAISISRGEGVRLNTVLGEGWVFKQGKVADGWNPGLDTHDWAVVSLPHNWGWEEAHRGGHYYRGPGWYRCQVLIPVQAQRRYFIRFEAASTVADVYWNGRWLGQHRGGFGAFAYEVTTNLSDSGTNLLAVCVDNAPQPDIAPLGGDFNVYGGLYRPVHLIETASQEISPLDHASPGVAWLQTEVSTNEAVLDVTAQVSNGADRDQTLTAVASVTNAEGVTVASVSQTFLAIAGYTEPVHMRLVLANPHLWNGRKDPYLYSGVLELRKGPELLDQVVQSVGLRFYRVDPRRGFYLNGVPYPVYGVCRHQDRPVKGWAIDDADMEEDVKLIQELGATAVRCAHYQHSDYFYHLCDQAGILVWAEIPQVNAVRDTAAFEDTSRGQLLDLIRQNINHPSIFVWSLFNEIGGKRTDDPHMELQDLNNVAHGEDPTRPTIAAACFTNLFQMTRIPDLIGWNFYPGWYSQFGAAGGFGAYLDGFRDSSRFGGYCISEYGAGANVMQHEENPGQPASGGSWHPEEWQSKVHEMDWAAIHERPYIWGSFVWNMFDFCVSTRHEGSQRALNDKGLVTYDRKIKKDAFYFYQANWSGQPMLHLTSQRFVERTNALTSVKVYSNLRLVTLKINGVSMGSRASQGEGVFVWPDVRLAPGDNHIEVADADPSGTLHDACVWHLTPQ